MTFEAQGVLRELKHLVKEVKVKSVLVKSRARDPWFLSDYSVNPYWNCQFNCIYCYIHGGRYAPPTSMLAAKVNAPEVLEKELLKRARRGEHGFIALSSSTEPWMPVEEKYELTRRCLRAISNFSFPVHCLTKSTLILRDLDLLEEVDRRAVLPRDLRSIGRGVLVTFSMSTINEEEARIFEPGAPKPSDRLKALLKVKERGLCAGVAFIPVLPFISDSHDSLKAMVREARNHGADYVFVGGLTLHGEGRELYLRTIERHYPHLKERYRELFEKPSLAGYYSRLEA
ncbi:MAG: radical SAM protein, partial [Thermoprotei archaeon]